MPAEFYPTICLSCEGRFLSFPPIRSPQRYNQPVVHTFPSSRFVRAWGLTWVGLLLAFSFTVCAQAQTDAESRPASGGRILLVLPFDNRTGQPSLEWIREAAAEILSSRLASAGFNPMSRADRIYALDHLGLPHSFHPSRASSIRLAETLDADSIIVGSYVMDGANIVAEAQLVNVPRLHMSPPVTARGEMREMITVFDTLAWKLARQIDPSFKVTQDTFVAAGSGLRLDAFEQYIRGITEPDQQERLRHLNQSVLLSPQFSPAWMALGREEYAGQKYEQAAEAFAKAGGNDADAHEASFFRGLSLLFSGDYAHAEEAFASVARVLPLAEVLNNQGVALARQGKDGTPLFRQAVDADPNGADYHFSLAVSLKRHGGYDAEALTELAQCLRLRPTDIEAQAVQKAWTSPRPAATGAVKTPATGSDEAEEEAEAKADPLERIQRTFDEVAFRQAALMLDQINSARRSAFRRGSACKDSLRAWPGLYFVACAHMEQRQQLGAQHGSRARRLPGGGARRPGRGRGRRVRQWGPRRRHAQNGGPPRLLRNDLNSRNAWLRVDLVGTRCQRDAGGARVEVHTPRGVLVQTMSPRWASWRNPSRL